MPQPNEAEGRTLWRKIEGRGRPNPVDLAYAHSIPLGLLGITSQVTLRRCELPRPIVGGQRDQRRRLRRRADVRVFRAAAFAVAVTVPVFGGGADAAPDVACQCNRGDGHDGKYQKLLYGGVRLFTLRALSSPLYAGSAADKSRTVAATIGAMRAKSASPRRMRSAWTREGST